MYSENNQGLGYRTIRTPGEVRLRAAEDGKESRTIEGYAILFDTPSAVLYDDGNEEIREIISPEAVTPKLIRESDILFTMFHDKQVLLARSKKGKGTLETEVTDKGVRFRFDAPNTADGDKAIELVRQGIIDGCSFAFTTKYSDPKHVAVETKTVEGKKITVCTVRKIVGLYDMTLTPTPAYPATSVSARDIKSMLHLDRDEKLPEGYVRAMREAAALKI